MPSPSRVQVLRPLWILAIVATISLGVFTALPGSVDAAAATPPPQVEQIVLPHAPADQGGTDSTNARTADWLMFAVTLGPFAVLMAGLLLLTFGIDRSEGRE